MSLTTCTYCGHGHICHIDAVSVVRSDLLDLLAAVNLAQSEKGDWRGALDAADALLSRLLDSDSAEPETRCADCGEVGETTGHMECQYPQNHE